MTWNLEQLREGVTFLFGDEQHECLSPSLNSIVDRETYARFHYQESKRILGEVLNDRDDQAILVDLIFGANRNAHHEFASRRKFAEAHVVAVKVVGWAHGILFIGYWITAIPLFTKLKWDPERIIGLGLASLLPFGTFVMERKWLR